jgi:hypothetical protein
VRRVLVAAAVATVLLGFALGYGLATRSTRSSGATASAPPPSSTGAAGTAVPPTTGAPTTAPPTTASTTTTEATTTAPPTITAPPTTAPSTTATTAPPTTPTPSPTTTAVATTAPRPPSTLGPPRVEVTYGADGANRFVIPRTGTATLTIRNTGGSASQWLVTGSGFSLRSASQGTLQPGQSAAVIIGPPAGELPRNEITGTISVLGAANSAIVFVIPRA